MSNLFIVVQWRHISCESAVQLLLISAKTMLLCYIYVLPYYCQLCVIISHELHGMFYLCVTFEWQELGNLYNKCPRWLIKQNSSYSDYFYATSGFTSNTRAPRGPVTLLLLLLLLCKFTFWINTNIFKSNRTNINNWLVISIVNFKVFFTSYTNSNSYQNKEYIRCVPNNALGTENNERLLLDF